MTDTVQTPTHVAHPPFKASQALANHLQQLHVDLIDLHLQGKQAHWNVVGKNFRACNSTNSSTPHGSSPIRSPSACGQSM